ncbi:MAG TPA: 16S rRNA (adenine(1518)-N(6)/adenine(1519)-N(6))-dimethyltransferase RsmA [Firmicutes bacterium]|nr:16S rRNA (adenine(1518)-N(6)/adenine(1519)-N(6))-dimethyltransferase RsmA [Bacillota bacterium]
MINLSAPSTVRRLIRENAFRYKKSIGQNFLVDGNVVQTIVKAAGAAPGQFFLEIGAGFGALTQGLANSGASVVAVEIDAVLAEVTRKLLADYPQVQIVTGDALRLDLASLVPPGQRCRVAANLPYYITSPLLIKLVESDLPVELLVVMVQKEVGERLLAAPGTKDYGALSVKLFFHAEVELVAQVPRTVFFPPPHVDSAILRLLPRPFPYPAADPATFSRVVRAAFAHRRKNLKNALLAAGLAAEALLETAGMDGKRRGESLSPEEFGRLSLAAAACR